MTAEKPVLALIGCGKMGGAMLRGWIDHNAASDIFVLDPAELPGDINQNKITHFKSPGEFKARAAEIDIAVIAVKPQILDNVCLSLKELIPGRSLIISIAAGKPLAAFEKIFGNSQPVIRAMPNTPAAIGCGITVMTPNAHVTNRQKEQAEALLSAVGKTEWLEEENMMDAVTAVSGSGPAYLFLFMELLAEAGQKAGLEEELAVNLARETVIGAAALAAQESRLSAETLRKNVTSPGGTTEAALSVLLENNNLESLLTRAVVKATARGKELSEN